jgi:hypothetical protein
MLIIICQCDCALILGSGRVVSDMILRLLSNSGLRPRHVSCFTEKRDLTVFIEDKVGDMSVTIDLVNPFVNELS